MAIKNPTDFLIQATALPAAIEGKLPAGAPKISETLTDVAGKLPVIPDLPVELPDLPAVPELPAMPALPEGAALRPYVTAAKVTPAKVTPAKAAVRAPAPVAPPVAPPAPGRPRVRFLY